jgi:hypothetical protein
MPTSPLWVVVSEILSPQLTWTTFLGPNVIGPNYSHFAGYSFSQHGRMHLCFNKLIAAFKDLMLIPTIEAKRTYLQHFVQMNKGQHYYEKHSIKYSKINQLRSIFLLF